MAWRLGRGGGRLTGAAGLAVVVGVAWPRWLGRGVGGGLAWSGVVCYADPAGQPGKANRQGAMEASRHGNF